MRSSWRSREQYGSQAASSAPDPTFHPEGPRQDPAGPFFYASPGSGGIPSGREKGATHDASERRLTWENEHPSRSLGVFCEIFAELW